jgi:hypothetical protein
MLVHVTSAWMVWAVWDAEGRWRFLQHFVLMAAIGVMSGQNRTRLSINWVICTAVCTAFSVKCSYLPRGAVHQAVAAGSDSSHLTISTYQRSSYADLATHLLQVRWWRLTTTLKSARDQHV